MNHKLFQHTQIFCLGKRSSFQLWILVLANKVDFPFNYGLKFLANGSVLQEEKER